MTTDELKKQIIANAKEEGLDLAEDAAERAARFALKTVGTVVAYTENKYDDLIWSGVEGKAQEVILELVDKIDGKEG